jgi:hypothetical protein
VIHQLLNFIRLLCLAAMLGAPITAATPASQSLTAMVAPERGLLEWHFQGRKLLAYAFATNQFKPYVRELFNFAGENVLLDAPADHLHHHGLMYAIWVNGVNFWEEAQQSGRQRHIQLLEHGTGHTATGLPQASFTELIHWVPHEDHQLPDTRAAAFLIERRTLTLTIDEANEEMALEWGAEFEAGARANVAKLHGSEYNGLGLRFPPAWNQVARHQNSEGTDYPASDQRAVIPARWSAVTQSPEGGATQVVLCAAPSGHGVNNFFTMTEPFTYLSATQGLDNEPLEYAAGSRFQLNYLLLVYSSAREPAHLEERYQAWSRKLKR